MKFKSLRPMLWTSELDESIAFYTETLGFTCVERDSTLGWAAVQRDDVELMLTKPNTQTPLQKAVFTGSFYIMVEDVDALWEQVKDKAKICYPVADFAWQMREFAIFDNNGYILQFGQDLAK